MTITATFRIVTPMFLGGAEPNQEAELRVPSVKGALRFWWRALMWWRGIHDHAELHKRESNMFGSNDSEIGQSKMLLRIEMDKAPTVLMAGNLLGRNGRGGGPNGVVAEGARYLGYGLMEAFDGQVTKAGRLVRSCLEPTHTFTLHIIFKRGLDSKEQQREEFLDALKLFGLCGGLGSRSRRGYGSLTLAELRDGATPIWKAPLTIFDWESQCKEVLGKGCPNSKIAEWTGFHSGSSKALLLTASAILPLDLLAKMGRDFVFFRSWGRNGKVLGLDSERRFKDDHDLMKTPSENRNRHPRRIAFGLPHNYGKYADQQVEPRDQDFDRRASSLFFHIHQANDQALPLGVLLFLPSRFLPQNRDTISVGGKNLPLAEQGEGNFWNPVHEFLERLRSGSGKEHFTETQLIQL